MKVEHLGKTTETVWEIYVTGRPALELVCENGEPWTTASVNIGHCPEDCLFIKEWSENEGITDALKKAGVICGAPVVETQCGFVTAKAYQLTDAAIKERDQQLMNKSKAARSRQILRDAGYLCSMSHSFFGDRDNVELEWWNGTKGTVILQYHLHEDGVQTYISWGHGTTLAELASSVKEEA
jgi:hypothetical protein